MLPCSKCMDGLSVDRSTLLALFRWCRYSGQSAFTRVKIVQMSHLYVALSDVNHLARFWIGQFEESPGRFEFLRKGESLSSLLG